MEITTREEGGYMIITIKAMRSPMHQYINEYINDKLTPVERHDVSVPAIVHQELINKLEDLQEVVEKAMGVKIFHHNSVVIRGWAAQWPCPKATRVRSSEHMIETYLMDACEKLRKQVDANRKEWDEE